MDETQTPNHTDTITLHAHHVERVQKIRPGMVISCEAGMVWLTESDDIHDYILQSGQQLTVQKRGKVLIEALDEACVSVLYPN
jgi:hypothetical protein